MERHEDLAAAARATAAWLTGFAQGTPHPWQAEAAREFAGRLSAALAVADSPLRCRLCDESHYLCDDTYGYCPGCARCLRLATAEERREDTTVGYHAGRLERLEREAAALMAALGTERG